MNDGLTIWCVESTFTINICNVMHHYQHITYLNVSLLWVLLWPHMIYLDDFDIWKRQPGADYIYSDTRKWTVLVLMCWQLFFKFTFSYYNMKPTIAKYIQSKTYFVGTRSLAYISEFNFSIFRYVHLVYNKLLTINNKSIRTSICKKYGLQLRQYHGKHVCVMEMITSKRMTN